MRYYKPTAKKPRTKQAVACQKCNASVTVDAILTFSELEKMGWREYAPWKFLCPTCVKECKCR